MFFDIFRQIRIGKIKPVCQIVQADLALIIRLNIILDLLDPDPVLRIFHMKSRIVRFHKKITCQDIKCLITQSIQMKLAFLLPLKMPFQYLVQRLSEITVRLVPVRHGITPE